MCCKLRPFFRFHLTNCIPFDSLFFSYQQTVFAVAHSETDTAIVNITSLRPPPFDTLSARVVLPSAILPLTSLPESWRLLRPTTRWKFPNSGDFLPMCVVVKMTVAQTMDQNYFYRISAHVIVYINSHPSDNELYYIVELHILIMVQSTSTYHQLMPLTLQKSVPNLLLLSESVTKKLFFSTAYNSSGMQPEIEINCITSSYFTCDHNTQFFANLLKLIFETLQCYCLQFAVVKAVNFGGALTV